MSYRFSGSLDLTPYPLRMWGIDYGWCLFGPYAHAVKGSTVKRTFIGPGAIRRAARWIEKSEGTR